MNFVSSVGPVPRGRPSKRYKQKVATQQRLLDDLLERVSPVVIAAPLSRANLKAIAEDAGVSRSALFRQFGSFEGLLSAVWDRQVKLVLTRLAYDPPATKGVQASIQVYASFVAGVMQSELYRGLLLLLVRYGADHAWMSAAYEKIICETVRRGLERVIYEGGEESGCAVVINEFAAADFHKKMETELATSRIIPPYQLRQLTDVNAVVTKIAADTFKATHALSWADSRLA